MNILYEDKDILVVEKPAGIPVETSRIGSKDMVSLLKNHLAETGGKPGGIPYLGMIHRLDQPVQGVMVFAKNQKAAASLSKEIAQNEMKKTYLAVVEGAAKEEESLIDYLLKDGRTNTSKKVPKGTKGAKESRLSYECLKTLEDPALAVFFQVLRHAVASVFKFQKLASHTVDKTAGPGDTIAHHQDGSGLVLVDGVIIIFDLAADDLGYFFRF